MSEVHGAGKLHGDGRFAEDLSTVDEELALEEGGAEALHTLHVGVAERGDPEPRGEPFSARAAGAVVGG